MRAASGDVLASECVERIRLCQLAKSPIVYAGLPEFRPNDDITVAIRAAVMQELAGVLSGLTRVRQFSQDDAHCFVMESQIGEEVATIGAALEVRAERVDVRDDIRIGDRLSGCAHRDG